jgi:hypothetical protein
MNKKMKKIWDETEPDTGISCSQCWTRRGVRTIEGRSLCLQHFSLLSICAVPGCNRLTVHIGYHPKAPKYCRQHEFPDELTAAERWQIMYRKHELREI